MNWDKIDLEKLNNMTKYPSIPTYHELDQKTGILTQEHLKFENHVHVTEKIDGTNARLIVFPNGSYIIGSRNRLLHYSSDRFSDPALGIVDIIKPLAERIDCEPNAVTVWYFEAYGAGIQCKNYSKSLRSCRAFDAALFGLSEFEDIMCLDKDTVSKWKGRGGQPFISVSELKDLALANDVDLVPSLIEFDSDELPHGLEEMYYFIKNLLPRTRAAIDETAVGIPEGVVIRTPHRTMIAKARFEDYERTFLRREKSWKKSYRS